MGLPSQSSRMGYHRNHMFRRKRLIPRLPLLVVSLSIIAFVGWLVWPDGSDADTSLASANPASNDTATPTPPAPTESNTGSSGTMLSGTTSLPHPPNASRNNDQADRRDDRAVDRVADRTAAKSNETTSPPAVINNPRLTPERNTAQESSVQATASRETVTAADNDDNTRQRQPEQASAPTIDPGAVERARQLARRGMQLDVAGNLVDARRELSAALLTGALPADEATRTRDTLANINDKLIFSPLVVPDDPFASAYKIQPGDVLEKIASRLDLDVDWRFIQRINQIADVRRIRAGQDIKIISGPFHAVVSKNDYRLDLYMGQGRDLVFVRSFPVGLGEYNATPTGRFTIGSRLIDPEWINPRTRERFLPSDPMNPIGEHWLELVGQDENNRDRAGYGIHGTIEPDSIGKQMSMGCVRMLPNDVAVVYEVLTPGVSVIEIR
ncbi:MAG: L,D-transpeptidase family protein [Phycisphaerales bacterium]